MGSITVFPALDLLHLTVTTTMSAIARIAVSPRLSMAAMRAIRPTAVQAMHTSAPKSDIDCSQVHWSWSRYRWSCRIWSRDWISVRITHYWIRQEPFTQAAALLIRYSGIRPVRGHGSVLFDDGLLAAVRFLDGETNGDTGDL